MHRLLGEAITKHYAASPSLSSPLIRSKSTSSHVYFQKYKHLTSLRSLHELDYGYTSLGLKIGPLIMLMDTHIHTVHQPCNEDFYSNYYYGSTVIILISEPKTQL